MYTIFCVVLLTFFSQLNGEVVEVQGGKINGTVGKSKNGRPFQQYSYIPFAEPPIGGLRFKPPKSAKPWSGIKDASKQPPRCIQGNSFLVLNRGNMSEDCLYLNVYVPDHIFNRSGNGKAPVIVWIYGGSYRIGSGADYDPRYLMDKDFILVTFNYRLGVLGFLSLNNKTVSGNFGLKDQRKAIRWVRDNIAAFGGDPFNITLWGESAGAASVHLHMFSPLSKRLFQKAIMQSGNAFAVWAGGNAPPNVTVTNAFLNISGCSGKSSANILKCLQEIPANDFIALEGKVYERFNASKEIFFRPVIESNVKKQPFLKEKPTKSNYLTKVPWICGINSFEGALQVSGIVLQNRGLEKKEEVDKKLVVSLLTPFVTLFGYENVNDRVQKIMDFYFESNYTGVNVALKFVDIITDSVYLYPLMKSIQSSKERKYAYLFDHPGSFSWQDFANLTIDLGRPSHADELVLLFYNPRIESNFTVADKNVSEKLITLWTNFGITGDPNGISKDKLWKPTKSDGPVKYLHIKSNSSVMEKNPRKEGYEFWERLLG